MPRQSREVNARTVLLVIWTVQALVTVVGLIIYPGWPMVLVTAVALVELGLLRYAPKNAFFEWRKGER